MGISPDMRDAERSGQLREVSSVRRPEDTLEWPRKACWLQRGEDAAAVVVDHDEADVRPRLSGADRQARRVMHEREVAEQGERRAAPRGLARAAVLGRQRRADG